MRPFLILRFIFGSVFLLFAACKNIPNKIDTDNKTTARNQLKIDQEWEQRSADMINGGDFPGALKVLLPIVQVLPDDYLVHYRLGACYEHFKRYDKAMASYSLAITLHPTPSSHQRRANINILNKDYKAALNDLEQCSQLLKKSPDVEFHTLKAHAFLNLGRNAEAIDSATLAIMEEPRSVDAYRIRGCARLADQSFHLAIKDFTQAINLDPNHAETYYNRSSAYLKTGDFDASTADSRKAISINPNRELFYSQLGNNLADVGQPQEAVVYLNKACEMSPTHINFAARGLCYAKLGQNLLAMTDFNQAIALAKEAESANWLGLRGRLKASAYADYKGAINDITKAIGLGANDADLYDSMGTSYTALNELENAIISLDKAIKLNPSNPLFYQHRGIAHSKNGNAENALKDFNKIISINPKIASAYNNRGYLLLSQGKIDSAIEDFDQCIKLDPDFGHAYSNRGTAKMLKDDIIGAALDQAKGAARAPTLPRAAQ